MSTNDASDSGHGAPLTIADIGGCTCGPDGHDFHTGDISPTCRYHQAAAEQPWNHHIPWNCPTFYDGCNCEEVPDGA